MHDNNALLNDIYVKNCNNKNVLSKSRNLITELDCIFIYHKYVSALKSHKKHLNLFSILGGRTNQSMIGDWTYSIFHNVMLQTQSLKETTFYCHYFQIEVCLDPNA